MPGKDFERPVEKGHNRVEKSIDEIDSQNDQRGGGKVKACLTF